MLERSVERGLVREAKRRGVWALKLHVVSMAGFPDRMCLASGGRIRFAEIKRPGADLRPLQKVIAKRLRRLGFDVWKVDSHEGIKLFFDDWLGTRS